MINLYFRTNYLKVKKLIFFHKWRFFDCHKPCYICRFNMLWFLCLCWHLWSLLLYIFRYLTSLQEVYLLDIFYKLQLTNIKGASQRKLMTLFPKIILFFSFIPVEFQTVGVKRNKAFLIPRFCKIFRTFWTR